MRKKKIIVTHAHVPFVRGGAELLVESLSKQLNNRGFEAEIVQLPWKWYPGDTIVDSVLAWRMLDITECNGEKIDLVIGTKFPSYVPKHPNKVLWLMHQHRPAYDLYDKPEWSGMQFIQGGVEARKKIVNIDNICIDECKQKYAISQNVANRLKKFNGRTAEALYHPPILEGRYESGEYGDYIFTVGRLEGLKRNDLLIKALVYCDKRIKAVIGGRGPEMDNLKKLAQNLGVANRVEFLGFVEDNDLIKLYANAFAVFFAPYDEDYGYITLEAMLSKKPVITCKDSGGVLEFVGDNECGLICDTEPEDLGSAINKLYVNKVLAENMGKLGFEKVKDISWNHVVDVLTSSIK